MTNRMDLPPPGASNYDQRVRETLMTYLGRQGDALDRGLTLRDLVESGIVSLGPNFNPNSGATVPLTPGDSFNDFFSIPAYVVDLTPPPVPTGFAVTSMISHVFIEHDPPIYTQGNGHLRTRVYAKRVAKDDPLPTFTDAVEVGQFSGSAWAMPSDPATTWRIWIKWETNDNVLSPTPAGGANGLEATTGRDVRLMLDALEGSITESQLYESLGARIDQIDKGPNSLMPRVDSIRLQYTVKIDNNGYVAGYGLASTATDVPESSFAVRADQFYIASPAGPGIEPAMPFIVRTTPTVIDDVEIPVGVYIREAFIQDATITTAKIRDLAVDTAKIADLAVSNAKIGTLDAGKINTGFLQANRIEAGSIDAKIANLDAAVIKSGIINNARIGDITSLNYIAGQAGWKISKAGQAEFQDAIIRGVIRSNDGKFVIDTINKFISISL